MIIQAIPAVETNSGKISAAETTEVVVANKVAEETTVITTITTTATNQVVVREETTETTTIEISKKDIDHLTSFYFETLIFSGFFIAPLQVVQQQQHNINTVHYFLPLISSF
jgi:hypothetical protein